MHTRSVTARRPGGRHVLAAAALMLVGGQALAQVTLYENEGFRGRALSVNRPVNDFSRMNFNDRVSSVVVDRGRWEVCEDARFNGRCVVLRRGSYDSLRSMGLENRISSIRPVNRQRYVNEAPPPPLPQPNYAWRQRPNERVFEAPVTAVRAVMGAPEQRCWVEQQAVGERRPDVNVPGAIIGGVLGGILGHQVGGGSGRTVATIGGAVGGGALGANIDRITGRDNATVTRNVRRCDNVPGSGQVQYYDVDYTYRGAVHHVQMATPPGRTITVNANGEPRM